MPRMEALESDVSCLPPLEKWFELYPIGREGVPMLERKGRPEYQRAKARTARLASRCACDGMSDRAQVLHPMGTE
jgi:hypothetical protein